jgi:hypothetical protein
MWDKVLKDMAENKIPYSPSGIYTWTDKNSSQKGDNSNEKIKIISPTEAQVQIAKSEVKRKRRDDDLYLKKKKGPAKIKKRSKKYIKK